MFERPIAFFSSVLPNSVWSALEEELGFMEDLFPHLMDKERKWTGKITLAWWLVCLVAKGVDLCLKDYLFSANRSLKLWVENIRAKVNHIFRALSLLVEDIRARYSHISLRQKFVVDAWEQFNNEDICWLSEMGKEQKLKSGEVLVNENSVNKSFHIVLHGTLDVFLQGRKMLKVARLSRGEMVGEIAFLCNDSKPSATVIVKEDCDVLSIDFQVLRAKLDNDPNFALRFYKVLAIKNACRVKDTRNLLKNSFVERQLKNNNLIRLEQYRVVP